MSMFSAYFDDSGTHADAKAVVVAGFAAPLEQWIHFERNWNEVLALPQFDLEYFHMKELRAGKGQFARFKDNLPLQTDLFQRLHKVIKIRTAHTTACAVLRDDWELVNAEFQVAERLGEPFTCASCVCTANVGEWMKRRHYHDELRIVFDQGTDGWGAMSDRMFDAFGTRPLPGESRRLPPLQAADLLAWELRRMMDQTIAANFAPKSIKYRGSLDQLMRQFVGDGWKYADEEGLRQMCATGQIPPRGAVAQA